LLPIASVVTVDPERRAVLLNAHPRSPTSTSQAEDAVAGAPVPVEQGRDQPGALQERVARYVSAGQLGARHLLFVSTPRGYTLVEADGSPPSLGQDVQVPEQGSFRVAKLGPSPLPDDPRPCAYLAQIQ
jgi:hypothetical protein